MESPVPAAEAVPAAGCTGSAGGGMHMHGFVWRIVAVGVRVCGLVGGTYVTGLAGGRPNLEIPNMESRWTGGR